VACAELLCLTEEDMGLLMSSVYSCCMHWREDGEKEGRYWGWVRGLRWGCWLWSRGHQGGDSQLCTRRHHSKYEGFFIHKWLTIAHAPCMICVSSTRSKYSVLCRLKINQGMKERNMRLFLAQCTVWLRTYIRTYASFSSHTFPNTLTIGAQWKRFHE
jgi:hypothetical protein